MGQIEKAVNCYEQALDIDRKISSRSGESAWLGGLGLCYTYLGQTTEAIDYLQQALAIARETGHRYLESSTLSTYGDVLVDQEEWSQAVQHYRDAIEIADEIGSVEFQQEARLGLAQAHLFSSDVAAGRAVVQAARKYDRPLNNHNVQALLGVIALRQSNLAEAHTAFETAVAQADELLHHNVHNFEALDTKGLALCGLALCGEANPVAPAVEAYRAARAINSDAGIVRHVLRLFDALAQADEAGVLADVRAAVGV